MLSACEAGGLAKVDGFDQGVFRLQHMPCVRREGMGKRVNFCARSVVTCDSYIKADEIMDQAAFFFACGLPPSQETLRVV